MSRSSKKGPFVDEKITKKINKLEESGKREVIRTWARASVISPLMVGHNIEVHNGRNFIKLYITEAMVGYRLGEFVPTRTFTHHSKKGVKKEA